MWLLALMQATLSHCKRTDRTGGRAVTRSRARAHTHAGFLFLNMMLHFLSTNVARFPSISYGCDSQWFSSDRSDGYWFYGKKRWLISLCNSLPLSNRPTWTHSLLYTKKMLCSIKSSVVVIVAAVVSLLFSLVCPFNSKSDQISHYYSVVCKQYCNNGSNCLIQWN